MSQIILAELLICIVTSTFVYTSAGTHQVGSVKAYIDPGTGSFVIQMLVASIAGVVYLTKMFWSNIKKHFLKFIHKRKKD
jgi:O-antigen/teichoic acid export membrane protein